MERSSSLPKARVSTDAQRKAIAAGAQLQQALESAADALKIIATAIPTLFPQDPRMLLPSAPKGSAATVQAASTPHQRKRKEKNPDAPDKPVSAYHLWSKENKDRIKASMPGVPSASEVVSEANRVWKELSDGVKKVCSAPHFPFSPTFLSFRGFLLMNQPFQEIADKDKARYREEIIAYEHSKAEQRADEIPAASASQQHPSPVKKTTSAKGGFTAVNAAPLSLNPEVQSELDHDSDDAAAVAADLGGSQPTLSVSEFTRQKKDSAHKRKGSKEKSREKETKENKDKKRRRKSDKIDS